MTDPSFEAFLAPHTAEFFLEEALGHSALFVAGSPDKFRCLFSWKDLNHLMKFGSLGFPRLRLMDGPRELPADDYLRQGISGYPRPLVHEINAALLAGATLAIESVEEIHEPAAALCEMIERQVEVPAQADLFVCGQNQTPMATRWNDHEAIVLQVEGQKAWRVYGPTAGQPTAEFPPPEPDGEPLWEGVLSPGSMLYLPRGWWYFDQAIEPALCIGVKFRNPTAADALRRVFERLTKSAAMRADLPRFAGVQSQSAFLKTFQREVAGACTSPGLLLGFLREYRVLSEPRIGFCFPWSVAESALPPTEDYLVAPLLRFPRTESVRHLPDENGVEVCGHGRHIRLDEAAGKVLTLICTDPTLSISDLVESFAGELGQEPLLTALSELVKQGLVELRSPNC